MGLFSGVKKLFKKAKKAAKSLLGIEMVEQAARANKLAKKARDDAKKAYQQERQRAEEIAAGIRNEEAERRKRIAARGTQRPQTLLGSYLGYPGGTSTRRTTLG